MPPEPVKDGDNLRKEHLTVPAAGDLTSPSDSASTLTASSNRDVDTSTGVRADEEKGEDVYLVGWNENDHEVGEKAHLDCLIR